MKTNTQNKYLTVALLVGAGLLTGCGAMIGWSANVFAPPKKVPPVYTPPAEKKILVFVDDILSPVNYEPVKGQLTEQLNHHLIEHDIANQTVAYEDLLKLIAATPNFNELAVIEVGQKLGADLVLYIHMDEFSLKDQEVSPLWRGYMETTIRVVDVREGRLWPVDRPAGYPVDPVEIPAGTQPASDYGEQLAQKVAETMAQRIAQLFYEHELRGSPVGEDSKNSRFTF